MTKWKHKVYLSDGTQMTGAEYDAAIASGKIVDRGHGILLREIEKFKEICPHHNGTTDSPND